MRTTLAAALAALLAIPAAALAQQKPREPRGLAGAGISQAQVDAAIERGKQFLIAQLAQKQGDAEVYPEGDNDVLLSLLALSHTDAFARDRALRARALDSLYKWDISGNYGASVVILALEHAGGRAHAERIGDAARILLENQSTADDGWAYTGPERQGGPPARAIPPEPAASVIEVAGGLPLQGRGGGRPVAPGVTHEGVDDKDNSNSQFAVLALHSASVSSVEAPADAWKRALAYFAGCQNPDGGFGYHPKDGMSYGSMTCAGITGLALALHHTGAKDVAGDPRVKAALAWLAKNLTYDRNPFPGMPEGKHEYHFYYVYGIERVGVLLNTPFLGEHEWYPEGAAWFLKRQREDGSWLAEEHVENEASSIADTSFALLFLTKATTPIAAPRGGTGTLRTALAAPLPAPKREKAGLLFVLDASGSMLDKIGGKTKWEVVRDAAKRLVKALPDDAVVGLRVYGHNQLDVAEKVSEKESELLLPIGRLDRGAFERIVDEIKPIGRTPIAESLGRCGGDLADGAACRVLLLSDGAETGGGDPVAAAKALAQNPKCLGIDCLGFDLASEPKARAQLQEVAKVGKGRYTESEDPEVLAKAGARASGEYVLLDAAGKEVGRGTLGDARPLPEGELRIRVTIGERPYEAALWINTGLETVATVHPERVGR